ncbi:PREDICTED: uncharacterized protein LOC105557891 [Vollenhovia emeryi]|uniref:uncharacterized protein LOC105557891 n=1 Tax=Vollenhovia emeryi TaxID=411798 RepID=UPI0005F3EC91|nr:PREDICTED: uncharacterized protein LOC105557891 [Vollenhovia emeryi]
MIQDFPTESNPFYLYKVQWYRAPIHIQKMILFLLQRETKEFTLTVGGLFTASMEGFAMLTPLFTLKCTSDVITKVLSSVSFYVGRIIEFNTFYVKIEAYIKLIKWQIKKLLTELQYIHNNLKDKNEIAIVKKYSRIAKRYTIAITVLAVFGVSFSIIIQFRAKLLNVIVPINISQPYQFPVLIEYFVDQEKYFYLIILHIYVTVCIVAIIMVATGTIYITCIQHTCGMFRIASYRIEHAMNFNNLQNITLENEILMTNGIIYAVNMQRQSMRYVFTLIIFKQYVQ